MRGRSWPGSRGRWAAGCGRIAAPRPERALVAGALLAALLAAGSARPRAAAALPIYAGRERLGCASCHVDPSGGGMRNGFGFEYMRARHAMVPEPRWPGLPLEQPEPAPGLTFGTDLRMIYDGVNQRQVGGFLNAHSSFIRMQSALYMAYAPFRAVTLYLNADLDAGDFGGPEWFGLVRGGRLGRGGYLRAGSFRIPYGLRIDDHTIQVRRDLASEALPGGFTLLGRGGDPRFPDVGFELGWSAGRGLAQLAVTNGSGGRRDARDRNLALTARFAHGAGPLLAGATTHLDTDGGEGGTTAVERRRYGAYGVLRAAAALVLLGEIDWAEDRTGGALRRALLAWAEADYFVGRDARLRFRYDFLDTDRDQERAAAERYTVEVDLTPFPLVTSRLGYRYTANELGPEIDELIALLHLHF